MSKFKSKAMQDDSLGPDGYTSHVLQELLTQSKKKKKTKQDVIYYNITNVISNTKLIFY